MNRKPEFLRKATNVYRTPRYIVRQRLCILYDKEEHNAVISRDTFFLRTARRDAEYEAAFRHREQIDGKRLPSTAYIREYKE